jgi:hypothetical protein
MRKILMAAALSALFVASASAAPPTAGLIGAPGRVTAIDQAGMTFVCHWKKTGDTTYRTTDKTIFRVGKNKGAFSDLKVGVTVHVDSHFSGKDRLADRVKITP